MRARGGEVAVEGPDRRIRQHPERGVEEADVAVHPHPVAARRVNAREHRNRGNQPCGVIDQ